MPFCGKTPVACSNSICPDKPATTKASNTGNTIEAPPLGSPRAESAFAAVANDSVLLNLLGALLVLEA